MTPGAAHPLRHNSGISSVPMTAKIEAEAGATAGKAWKCLLCTYVYDEATGSPAHGIPPGTRCGEKMELPRKRWD